MVISSRQKKCCLRGTAIVVVFNVSPKSTKHGRDVNAFMMKNHEFGRKLLTWTFNNKINNDWRKRWLMHDVNEFNSISQVLSICVFWAILNLLLQIKPHLSCRKCWTEKKFFQIYLRLLMSSILVRMSFLYFEVFLYILRPSAYSQNFADCISIGLVLSFKLSLYLKSGLHTFHIPAGSWP